MKSLAQTNVNTTATMISGHIKGVAGPESHTWGREEGVLGLLFFFDITYFDHQSDQKW